MTWTKCYDYVIGMKPLNYDNHCITKEHSVDKIFLEPTKCVQNIQEWYAY